MHVYFVLPLFLFFQQAGPKLAVSHLPPSLLGLWQSSVSELLALSHGLTRLSLGRYHLF